MSEVGKALKKARSQVQALLGAEHDSEIIFTSCGTESDSTAILSALKAQPDRNTVITTNVEHPAILTLCDWLEKEGYIVHKLKVDKKGRIDMDEYKSLLNDRVAVVSAMWANNETGTIFPVVEMAELASAKGIMFHTDAVQAVGKIPIDLKSTKIDMLSLSGHKLHAPKGIGVLYLRRGCRFRPLLRGEAVLDWPTSMYYRYWEHDDPHHHVPAHYGVRTERHKLIRYYGAPLGVPGSSDRLTPDEWELFDLDADPHELVSVADDPAYAGVRAELEAELARLQAMYGDEPYRGPGTPHPEWGEGLQQHS